jgi:hypothetical protein
VVIVLQGSLGATKRRGKSGGNLASCHGPSMVNQVVDHYVDPWMEVHQMDPQEKGFVGNPSTHLGTPFQLQEQHQFW